MDTHQEADTLCNPTDRRSRFPSYRWQFGLCQLIKNTAGHKAWSGVRPQGSSDECLIGFSHNVQEYEKLIVLCMSSIYETCLNFCFIMTEQIKHMYFTVSCYLLLKIQWKLCVNTNLKLSLQYWQLTKMCMEGSCSFLSSNYISPLIFQICILVILVHLLFTT